MILKAEREKQYTKMKKEVANKAATDSKKLAGIEKIKTLGQLIKSGYQSKSIKEEVRDNLVTCLQNKENPFTGILGYEDTVIPDTERALLSLSLIHISEPTRPY